MLVASSSSRMGSKVRRGWAGSGTMRSSRISLAVGKSETPTACGRPSVKSASTVKRRRDPDFVLVAGATLDMQLLRGEECRGHRRVGRFGFVDPGSNRSVSAGDWGARHILQHAGALFV